MSRIKSGDCYGAKIEFTTGTVADYLLQSDGRAQNNFRNIQFKADSVMFREIGGNLTWYFAENANSIMSGDIGITANADVSVYMNGAEGMVCAAKTARVSFYYPGIKGVKVNGKSGKHIDISDGYVTIELQKGEAVIELDFEGEYG